MVKSQEKEKQKVATRAPSPKNRRPVIPASFQIRRQISPMAQILDEYDRQRSPVESVSPTESVSLTESDNLSKPVSPTESVSLTENDSLSKSISPTESVSLTENDSLTESISLTQKGQKAPRGVRLMDSVSPTDSDSLMTAEASDIDPFEGLPKAKGHLKHPHLFID